MVRPGTMVVWALVGVIMSAALLGGCGGSGDETKVPTATARIVLVDAPARQIRELHVRISAIELVNRANAAVKLLGTDDLPPDIELVGLRNSPLELGRVEVPEGFYTEARVLLSVEPNAHRLRTQDGRVHSVALTSDDPEGEVRVVRRFRVTAGEDFTLLLDFAAAASVFQPAPGGPWLIRPTVFVHALDDPMPRLGSAQGSVLDRAGEPIRPEPGTAVGVYIWRGNLEGTLVSVSEVSGDDGGFSLPALVPGDYTLTVRRSNRRWEPVGDPLPLLVNGEAANSISFRVWSGTTTRRTVTVDM